ncbi:hypothetical protein B0I71DRAFT_137239 [Yarrowia lipolytica]|uniref:Stationary phase protein 5 n=1 Tax=Yarrowia lipolytica TaxID=4952 RepID=A0A371BX31_YARLL|nr:hypothetical protein B0I71DRAFT_137239 [Yarrowia lipolytica]
MPFFKNLVRFTRDVTRDFSRTVHETYESLAFNISLRCEARLQAHREVLSYARAGRPLTFRQKFDMFSKHRQHARRMHTRHFSSNNSARHISRVFENGYNYQRAPGCRRRITYPLAGYAIRRAFSSAFERKDTTCNFGRRLYATMAMPCKGIHKLQKTAFGGKSIVEVTSQLRVRELDLCSAAQEYFPRYFLPVEVESVTEEESLFQSSSWVACLEPTSTGTFVDFNFAPQLSLEAEQLTTESLDQLERDLQAFVQETKVLLKDIKTVCASLGELPVTVNKNNVRVHFPNADAEKVNIMLKDIGVTRGVITEEESSDSSSESLMSASVVETNWNEFLEGSRLQPAVQARTEAISVSDLCSTPPSLSESPSSASSYSLSNESSQENTHMDSSVEIVSIY